jgi:hypothetical protein
MSDLPYDAADGVLPVETFFFSVGMIGFSRNGVSIDDEGR